MCAQCCTAPLPADKVLLYPAWWCPHGHQLCLFPSDPQEHLKLVLLLLAGAVCAGATSPSPAAVSCHLVRCEVCPRITWRKHMSKMYLVIALLVMCSHSIASITVLDLCSFLASFTFLCLFFFFFLRMWPKFPRPHQQGTPTSLDPDNLVEGKAQFQNRNWKSNECWGHMLRFLSVKNQKGIGYASRSKTTAWHIVKWFSSKFFQCKLIYNISSLSGLFYIAHYKSNSKDFSPQHLMSTLLEGSSSLLTLWFSNIYEWQYEMLL